MDEKEFWKVISLFDWDKEDESDVIQPVLHYLINKSEKDIFDFEDILTQKLHNLDTRAHAKAFVDSDYLSPDLFLYARCAVVANGKEAYDFILTNPEKFPQDFDMEELLYISSHAYKQKTGKEWSHYPSLSYETGANEEGWKES